jgi:hypothetical protein
LHGWMNKNTVWSMMMGVIMALEAVGEAGDA